MWFKKNNPSPPAAPPPVPADVCLRGVPHRHPQVQAVFDPRRGHLLTWTAPVAADAGGWRWLQEILPRRHRLVLDPLGQRTWELVDGRRCVAEIAAVLAAESGQPLPRTQAALLVFLTQLMKRNVIAVTVA